MTEKVADTDIIIYPWLYIQTVKLCTYTTHVSILEHVLHAALCAV